MSILDKALGIIGLRRIKNAIYKGAESSRLAFEWATTPIRPDKEIEGDAVKLRARARDLSKNNAIIRQYLTLLSQNVIGEGIKLQAKIYDNSGQLNRTFNTRIETAWSDWSEAPTIEGNIHLTQLTQLILKTVATDGEIFVRKLMGGYNRHGFALQTIDADLLDITYSEPANGVKNEIRLGIEVDSHGKPIAYHFYNCYADQPNRKRYRVPADEVIHLYDPERANQIRGVSWFNSIMVPIKILDGYIEAELVAARTGASKMGFFKYDDAGAYEGSTQTIQMEASPGTFSTLPPGMSFQGWTPEHPSAAFPFFVKSVQRVIASGLRVSYNALANDLENVNYSSIRSGLLIERDNWRILQSWFINRFMAPVYKSWLSSALLAGSLSLDSRDFRKFLSVKFVPRGWQWVDPLKDVKASIEAISAGLDTRTRILAEKGTDFEDIVEEAKAEAEMMKQYGITFTTAKDEPESPDKQKEEDKSDNEELV